MRGEDMQFHDKKNKEKYKELLLNSALQLQIRII